MSLNDSKIDQMSAMRALLNLMSEAKRFGAKLDPTVWCDGYGENALRFSTLREPSQSEIAAWQLATGSAWEMQSSWYMGRSAPRRTRKTRVTYQGITVEIQFTHSEQVTA